MLDEFLLHSFVPESKIVKGVDRKARKYLFNTLVDFFNFLKRISQVMGQSRNTTPEERQTENEQSALIVGIAKQMINNGDLILRTEKLMAQTKSLKNSYAMRLITG